MNNYEEWAQLVAKKLKGEADLLSAIDKDELDDAAATEAFSRAVLEPFLPENFGIGAGRIVDAFGNYSEYLDIIVYNRDFPRIGLRGTHTAFLYESVLAAFAVRSKFIRKTFFDALNACASLADLETNIDKTVLVRLAKKNGLTLGPNKKFIHRDPLHTARFDLIGRPPAFVFGFSGIKQSYRQLQENVELWISHRQEDGHTVEMKSLPAVIGTQGCFAWRNAAPLALSNREMLGIGNDDAPIRLIVLQLLYLLNRRLNVTSDGYGLKPNLKAYLSQFSPPRFEVGAGDVDAVADAKPTQTAADSAKPADFAQDRSAAVTTPAAPEKPTAASAPAKPVAESAPAKPVTAPAPAKPAPAAAPEEPATVATPEKAKLDKPSPFTATPSVASEPAVKARTPAEAAPEAAVFDKPPPFASAPSTPAAKTPAAKPTAEPSEDAAVFDKPSPFASAPIPAAEPSKPEAPRSPPSAPLGSAPIPDAGAARQEPPGQTLTANVIPKKPPVDIELTAETASIPDKEEAEEDEFTSTVVMPPPNGGGTQNTSTDAFIARVKEQLSSSDPIRENEKEKDSFSSTIPQ